MLQVNVHKHFAGRQPFTLEAKFVAHTGRGPVVLFGASGSGKSLTLQCISGIVRPDSGYIRLGSRTLFDAEKNIFVPTRERRVGFMFQDYALFPHLTVLQNVAYGQTGLLPRRVTEEQKARIMPILEMLDSTPLAHRYPTQISGGQRQRTALALALSIEPDILLLDEPFSALDPLLRRRLRAELRELLERVGVPAVVITHDPEDVTTFGDTLVVYNHGRAWVKEGFDRTLLTGEALCQELVNATAVAV